MKKPVPSLLGFAMVMIALVPADLMAGQKRRVVVRRPVVVRHPVVRTKVVVRPGYPLKRVLPAAVFTRPARKTVIVNKPFVYLPALAWSGRIVILPPGPRLVWQDSESITRDEDWVDTNFGVDASGKALFLNIDGRARLNFAEVTFANGNVQLVDFNEQTHGTGTYQLLDFTDGRHVSTVRILARSDSYETKLAVYLSK